MTTVKQARVQLANMLQPHSATPRLDAELLIATVTNQVRAQLFAAPERELSMTEEKRLHQFAKRRMAQEPLAFILGTKEFWSLNFEVTPAALIPRPETEMLVDWALKQLPATATLQLADLGTGAGAIAIALAHERPQWTLTATDNSQSALLLAKHNAAIHALHSIDFYHGEWCQALPKRRYHAILSNPPYIPAHDPHLSHLQYEPLSALEGGADGLAALRVIITQARDYLLPGGWLVLEHGYDQRAALIRLLQASQYRDIKDYVDLAGHPRMIVGRN